MRILSIGEVLWDVFEGRQEFLGGAPLNFCIHASRLGHTAFLLSAVGNDDRGSAALKIIQGMGISAELIQTVAGYATGTAHVTVDEEGNIDYLIDRPAAFDRVHLDGLQLPFLPSLAPDWIYFGTLAQVEVQSEQMLRRILEGCPKAKCFYDINLRKGQWNIELVGRLCDLATAVKLNESEARALFHLVHANRAFNLEIFCRSWSEAFGLEAVCVTLGKEGCAILARNQFCRWPGFRVRVEDAVGAGDAFAAGFLHGLGAKWPIADVAAFANAMGALVASRRGAIPTWNIEECKELMKAAIPGDCV
jgi:fructokinase